MPDSLPLLARQPIFDTKMNVVAYELLCRSSHVNQADFTDGDSASSQVLLNAFTELSIEEVVGQHRAFINFTRKLLSTPPPFDSKQLVIEVLEGQHVDASMLHALKVLRQQEYTIALDDFVLTDDTTFLLPYADIIKLDVLHLTREELVSHVEQIKMFDIQLLAEKIETHEMLDFCKNIGFDFFQGYFLARPQIMTGRKIAGNKQSALQLLSILYDPDVEIEAIEKAIARDTVLSYKLLRVVNSSAIGLSHKVDSLKQAIILLGLNKIKNWVNILIMSNLGNKPNELSVAALTRARMCEMIANCMPAKTKQDGFFTVGLLSMLDAFMDMPLDVLLNNLSMSQHINDAILYQVGMEGKVLDVACAYERGEWDKIDWLYLQQCNINPTQLARIYIDTLTWVNKTMSELGMDVPTKK